jgi:hypothetical protein
MTAYRTFTAGQKVKDRFGHTFTVLSQDKCQVFIVELCGRHIHPANLRAA